MSKIEWEDPTWERIEHAATRYMQNRTATHDDVVEQLALMDNIKTDYIEVRGIMNLSPNFEKAPGYTINNLWRLTPEGKEQSNE